MIDKKEMCLKILDFLGFKDVSLHEHTLKFTSKSGKAVYPLFHHADNMNKLWIAYAYCQSVPFNCLCDMFLNDIVEFKYVDSYGNYEKFEDNPFNELSVEEALVFLDMNGGL